MEASDPISNELSCSLMRSAIELTPNTEVQDEETSDERTINAIHSKHSTTITPEELSKLWCIGLQTAKNTLKSTTHQAIRTTGLLAKRFKTDKAQL